MSVGQQGGDQVKRPGASGDEWGALREDVGGIAEAAVSQGRHFINSAKDHATDYADKRKPTLPNPVADLAASLRESTSTFEERPNIQAIVDSAAEGLDQLAGSIRERSFAEIFSDMETMVRRRPATFGVAAVAVGFRRCALYQKHVRGFTAGAKQLGSAFHRAFQLGPARNSDGSAAMSEYGNSTIKSLLGEALRESGDLAQKEFTLFRTEMSQNVRSMLVGAGMMVAAAVLAVAALMLFTEALVDWLATVLDFRALAALIVGGAMALIAVGLVLYGRHVF